MAEVNVGRNGRENSRRKVHQGHACPRVAFVCLLQGQQCRVVGRLGHPRREQQRQLFASAASAWRPTFGRRRRRRRFLLNSWLPEPAASRCADDARLVLGTPRRIIRARVSAQRSRGLAASAKGRSAACGMFGIADYAGNLKEDQWERISNLG